MIGTFSAGIGALIVNEDDGKYLILKRSPKKDYAAGAWECVTGRVDQGEGFEDALHREVLEELKIEVQPLFVIGTTHFYRGPERPEYELVGIVYCCTSPNPENIRLSHEHTEYRWLTSDEARELLSSSDLAEHWLITVIERAEAGLRLYPTELLDLYRRQGFELDS
jgi:8-oxo-dGTP pyrophosphatase MutT (NUDIX family)